MTGVVDEIGNTIGNQYIGGSLDPQNLFPNYLPQELLVLYKSATLIDPVFKVGGEG